MSSDKTTNIRDDLNSWRLLELWKPLNPKAEIHQFNSHNFWPERLACNVTDQSVHY